MELFIHTDHGSLMIISAPTAGPHHAPVQHARHANVLHVHILPAGLRRYVHARDARAHNLMRSVIFDRRSARERHAETPVADQLPISHGLRLGLPITETTPLVTVSFSMGVPSRAEANFSSACRPSAAARRIRGPPRAIPELAYVPP